jgi:hypothetical protein
VNVSREGVCGDNDFIRQVDYSTGQRQPRRIDLK